MHFALFIGSCDMSCSIDTVIKRFSKLSVFHRVLSRISWCAFCGPRRPQLRFVNGRHAAKTAAYLYGNFPLGVDVGALSAWIASLKGYPRGRHLYRRPLGWRLRQGYHTDRPT